MRTIVSFLCVLFTAYASRAQVVKLEIYKRKLNPRDKIAVSELKPYLEPADAGIVVFTKESVREQIDRKIKNEIVVGCEQHFTALWVGAIPSDVQSDHPKISYGAKSKDDDISISQETYLIYLKEKETIQKLAQIAEYNSHLITDLGEGFFFLKKDETICTKDRSFNFWELIKQIVNETLSANCPVFERVRKEKQERTIQELVSKVDILQNQVDSIRNAPKEVVDNNNFILFSYNLGFGQSLFNSWSTKGSKVTSGSSTSCINVGYLRRLRNSSLIELNVSVGSGGTSLFTDSLRLSSYKSDIDGNYYQYNELYRSLNERMNYRFIGMGAAYLYHLPIASKKSTFPEVYVAAGLSLFSVNDITYSASTDDYTSSARFSEVNYDVYNVPAMGFYSHIHKQVNSTILQSSRMVAYASAKVRVEKGIFKNSGASVFMDFQFQFGSNLISGVHFPNDTTYGRLSAYHLNPLSLGIGLKYQL